MQKVESSLVEDQDIVDKVFHELAKKKPSIDSLRIGLTGSPGVGKSTLVEALGQYLTANLNQDIAVLVFVHILQVSRCQLYARQ